VTQPGRARKALSRSRGHDPLNAPAWPRPAPGTSPDEPGAVLALPNEASAMSASAAEDHFVHDASGRQREQAGDDKREGENPDHGLAMATDVVLPRTHDG
jgi:hypothetical protein